MEHANKNPDIARPVIHMIDEESDKIEALAMRMESSNPKVAELLYQELDRAEFHPAEDMPPHTVTMNCIVEFIDEKSGMRRMMKLVYPKDADIEKDRLSVFTPMGAGLIGMVAGETIAWPDRSGAERMLRIVNVRPPEESDAA